MLLKLLESIYTNISRNAFCIKNKYYTYGELFQKIKDISFVLASYKKTKSLKRVAILCTDDIEVYASIIASWFNGIAYVPLGLHNPVDRNVEILNDSSISVILTTNILIDKSYSEYDVVNLKNIPFSEFEFSIKDEFEQNEAYILFTSGSTGSPKGVVITQKNLNAFITSFENSGFSINDSSRCLQMFELTFDVSVSSFVPPLLGGACVYTVPNNVIKYIHVIKLIRKYELTCIQIVPSIINLAKGLLKNVYFHSVQDCILTGEATSLDIFELLADTIPNSNIYNYYGPTEATIFCSFYKIPRNSIKNYNGMLAIGKAFKNVKLQIVDDFNNPVPQNIKGELLIGGDQITMGYLNNDIKNKESFVFLKQGAEILRFYRSGDMCYFDNDNDLIYCGRFDNQIKIQGFRIELSEIESVVRKKFSLNNIVVPFINKMGLQEMMLVLEQNDNELNSTIQEFIKETLPTYMFPSKIVCLSNFPLSSSGKIDRKKIKELTV